MISSGSIEDQGLHQTRFRKEKSICVHTVQAYTPIHIIIVIFLYKIT
jgi:hypothetical protein